MTNMTLLNDMISRYNALAYTHNYIFGFSYKGVVYMAHTDVCLLPQILKLDKASRGAGMALRFCPTNDIKVYMLQFAKPLCSTALFDNMVSDSKYNKGEIFEKLVTEAYGQEWVKDNIPFTEAGDIEVDGIAYQIKYEKATFTNEKSLTKMENRG
jgi:hypothetical protein